MTRMSHRTTTGAALPLALALLLGPAAAQAGGRVTGVITTKAKASRPASMKVTQDQKTCGQMKDDETLLAKDGKLANAVVIVEGLPPSGKKTRGAELGQKQCAFVPHVQTVLKGSKVVIHNNDPVLHNVHSYDEGGRTLFNLAMPLQGQQIKKKLKKPGPVRVGCDAGHTWMSAWIYVVENSFAAVTGADGSFSIDGVPPGEHTVKIWHERLGSKTVTVTVAEGGEARVDAEL